MKTLAYQIDRAFQLADEVGEIRVGFICSWEKAKNIIQKHVTLYDGKFQHNNRKWTSLIGGTIPIH